MALKMKYAVDQFRLALSEWLIWRAAQVAPDSHPDSEAIYQAAAHVAARQPTYGSSFDE